MAESENSSLFAICVAQMQEAHPNATELEIVRLASERENIIKGAMNADYEKKLKAENERAVKEAERVAAEKEARQREKEW